jgi:hypothetical protein
VKLALRDEPRRFEDLSFDQQEKYRTYAGGETLPSTTDCSSLLCLSALVA